MITLLLFILLLTTLCLGVGRNRKAYALFSFMTIVAFLGIGCGAFPALFLNDLQSRGELLDNPHWAKKNAIVLLGAGSVKLPDTHGLKPTVLAYSRITETAKLYFSCKKTANVCTIIVSGGDASKTGKPEATIYEKELRDLGVNESDILLEEHSMNTYQNAEFTSVILKSKSFDYVLLVTSGLHMKRALMYFSYFGIHADPAASDYIAPVMLPIPIGFHFAISDFIMHEYIGMIRFHIYNYFGWNVKARSPGVA